MRYAVADEPSGNVKQPGQQRQGKRQGQHAGQRSGRGGDKSGPADPKKNEEAPKGEFRTDVPAHPLDIVLGRPTPSSVTLSVLFYDDAGGCVYWGVKIGRYTSHTSMRAFKKGEPADTTNPARF